MKSARAKMPDRQFRLCRINQRHAVANEAFQQRIYGNAAEMPRRLASAARRASISRKISMLMGLLSFHHIVLVD